MDCVIKEPQGKEAWPEWSAGHQFDRSAAVKGVPPGASQALLRFAIELYIPQKDFLIRFLESMCPDSLAIWAQGEKAKSGRSIVGITYGSTDKDSLGVR